MKIKKILSIPLLLFLSVTILFLSSCNNNDDTLVKSGSSDNEHFITIEAVEDFTEIDTRNYSEAESQIIQQKIDDNLILETEVFRERLSDSRLEPPTRPLAIGTKVRAIVYKDVLPHVVYSVQDVENVGPGVTVRVPNDSKVIIDLYSVNSLTNFPSEDQIPAIGTPREDVKYIMDLERDSDLIYVGGIEYIPNWTLYLIGVHFKHQFSQVAVQLTSEYAGVIMDFAAHLSEESSYKSTSVSIKDCSLTNNSGSRETHFKNSGTLGITVKSDYETLIPNLSTTSHKLILTEIIVEDKNRLKTPVTVELSNNQLPLNTANRYLIKMTIKTELTPQDVPCVDIGSLLVASANLQYSNGKWFVGNDPTYTSGDANGDDYFKWNSIYPKGIISNEKGTSDGWQESHDPCTLLGTGWRTPTDDDWAHIINDRETLVFDNDHSPMGIRYTYPNGTELFFPHCGHVEDSILHNEQNDQSHYRIGQIPKAPGWVRFFDFIPNNISGTNGSIGSTNTYKNIDGCAAAIRCVKTKS
jgi:hypothetical protein